MSLTIVTLTDEPEFIIHADGCADVQRDAAKLRQGGREVEILTDYDARGIADYIGAFEMAYDTHDPETDPEGYYREVEINTDGYADVKPCAISEYNSSMKAFIEREIASAKESAE